MLDRSGGADVALVGDNVEYGPDEAQYFIANLLAAQDHP